MISLVTQTHLNEESAKRVIFAEKFEVVRGQESKCVESEEAEDCEVVQKKCVDSEKTEKEFSGEPSDTLKAIIGKTIPPLLILIFGNRIFDNDSESGPLPPEFVKIDGVYYVLPIIRNYTEMLNQISPPRSDNIFIQCFASKKPEDVFFFRLMKRNLVVDQLISDPSEKSVKKQFAYFNDMYNLCSDDDDVCDEESKKEEELKVKKKEKKEEEKKGEIIDDCEDISSKMKSESGKASSKKFSFLKFAKKVFVKATQNMNCTNGDCFVQENVSPNVVFGKSNLVIAKNVHGDLIGLISKKEFRRRMELQRAKITPHIFGYLKEVYFNAKSLGDKEYIRHIYEITGQDQKKKKK